MTLRQRRRQNNTPRIRPTVLSMDRVDGYQLRFPLPAGGALMVSPQEPGAAEQLVWPMAPGFCPALPPWITSGSSHIVGLYLNGPVWNMSPSLLK